MNDCAKFQWTGQWTTVRNGISISENFTFRLDDLEDLKLKRQQTLDGVAPASVQFPNDEGPVARTVTQEVAPLCPVHGTPMSFKPPGISKTSGKPYQGFWSCGQRNADNSYCRAKPEVKS